MVELGPGPNRVEQHAYKNAYGGSYGNCWKSGVGQLEQFINAIARNRNQAECQDEYHGTIIEPSFDCWNESCESSHRSCKKDTSSFQMREEKVI